VVSSGYHLTEDLMYLSRIATTLCMAPVAAGAIFAGCGGNDEPTEESPKSLEERIFGGSQADFAEQQKLIRECMVRQGFDYTPQDNRNLDNDRLAFDPDSEDFVKEYGFGISTLFSTQIDISELPKDPNQDYRASLDETQQKAYDKALYGQSFEGGFTAGGGSLSGGVVISIGGDATGDAGAPTIAGPGGCLGEALKATGDEPNAIDTSLFDELSDLEDRIFADPKMVEAMKKWSACMADSGYDYRDRPTAVNELRKEFGDLTGLQVAGDGGGFVVSSGAIVIGGERDEGQAFDPFADVDKAKLAELQAKEKRIAAASLECSEKHVAKVEQQVRERYEEEFLAEHPELEAD